MNNQYASKLIIFVFALMFSFSVASAQSAFTLDPGNSISETVNVMPNDSGYADMTIYLKNSQNQPLILEWKTISNTLPTNWDVQLCDWTKCFSSVIAGRVMDTISTGGQGFIKLTVGPIYPNTIGSGQCVFDVWVYGDTADKVTLTYTINGLVGVEENILESNLVVYPNPIKNQLNLNTGSVTLDKVTLFDLSGKIVAELEQSVTGDAVIETAHLAPGVYLLEARSGKARLTKKILKTE